MFDFLKSKSELLAKYEEKTAYYKGKIEAIERTMARLITMNSFMYDEYVEFCGKFSLYTAKALKMREEIDKEMKVKAMKMLKEELEKETEMVTLKKS